MRKYLLFIALTFFVQNGAVNKSLEEDSNSKQSFVNHEYITGQWVETSDLDRLKKRNLTPPHPFNVNTVSHLTCFKEGRPFYDNYGTIYTFLEKKNDYYEYMSEDEKLTLRFSVIENDTTMTLEHKFRSYEPLKLLLSKVPLARSCDFKVTVEEGIMSGIKEAYNYYYFKGEYRVKDIVNNSTVDVEISSNNTISGLKGFDVYGLHTFGFNIRVKLFRSQKEYRAGVRKFQNCRLVAKDYGFDLYRVPKKSYINTLEKLYEFRRK